MADRETDPATGGTAARLPDRMRAVVAHRAGGPDVLTVTEVDRPAPAMTEVLVRVHAAGVNPTDWKTRARGRFPIGVEPPYILGYDVSGTVVQVGRGVTIHQPGDEVFGMLRYPYPGCAYAEYVTAPARHVTRKPPELDHVQAAALPLAGLTAWQALVDTADLQPGQRVLIHAAAGGVGHLAVQIAKARGAYVIGTARSAKHDLVRRLGADEVVDYTIEDFAVRVTDVDAVVDPIGGGYGNRSLACLRSGGVLVSLVPPDPGLDVRGARARGIRVAHMLVEPDQAGMRAIADLVGRGLLSPVVDAVFPLELAAEAHRRGETNRTAGKIVLAVGPDAYNRSRR